MLRNVVLRNVASKVLQSNAPGLRSAALVGKEVAT
jgi:hypothetical protein